jgi:translocation and assembly module TamA
MAALVRALASALLAIALSAAPACALDYEVHHAPSGAAEFDAALPRISALMRLADAAVPDGFSLVARAREDAERLEDAARSLGFHGAVVDIHLDGMPVDDPDLPAALDDAAAVRRIPVDITVVAGPAYRLRRVGIEGLPPDVSARPPLRPGDVARARDILDAEAALRETLRDGGHAFARIERQALLVDHAARAVDVDFVATPGPRLALGTISLGGLADVGEDFARRRLGLTPGTVFDPRRIEAARANLARTGLFAGVRAREAAAPDAEGRIPVAFDVTERPPRSLSVGAAYSTDEGAMLSLRWLHRNLAGGGEQLRLAAELSRLLVEAVDDPTGRIDAQLRLPDTLADDVTLRLDAGALRERLDAYDREAVFAGAAGEMPLGAGLGASFGLSLERAQIADGAGTRHYTLLATPLTLELDSSDDRLEPTRGWRLGAHLAPTRNLVDTGAGFLTLRGAVRTYLDLGSETGRSVLALRATAGTILASARDDVPADRRFYAGGGGSVRGYAYQSIGPRDARGEPGGGLSLVEAAAELRQRFGQDWGAVLFVDAGGAAATRRPPAEALRAGFGGGLRYYTPIGAIRADIGVPLRADDGTGRFAVYIGIGQAF